MTVDLPWYPASLSPNAKRRKHWTHYRGAAKHYREECWALTLAARAKGTLLAVAFYPPDRRGRDDDSMIGGFKNGRDGVADALGVNDRTFRPAYSFHDAVPGGKIVVTIGPFPI